MTLKALVLSGGGSKGAYQVGVLKRLLVDSGNKYDIVTGISVGAINASYIAQFPVDEKPARVWECLADLWGQVTTSKIRKGWFPFGPLEALWKSSVYNSDPLGKWVRSGLDSTKVARSGRTLRIVTVSYDSGESFVATEKMPDIASWVLASAAFPVMLAPISIEGQLWADGGVRSVTPLGEAIRAGASAIDVVLCGDPDMKQSFQSKGKAACPALTLRTIELITNQIMRADLKIAGLKNDLAGPYRKVAIRVFKPSIDLDTIQSSLDFEQGPIQKMIQIGYDDAKIQG